MILPVVENQEYAVVILITVFMTTGGNGKPAGLMVFVAQTVIVQAQRYVLLIDVFVLLEDAKIIKEIVWVVEILETKMRL